MILNFIFGYLLVGFILSLFMNATLWAFHKPILSISESIATIILWPTVMVSFLNSYYGYTDADND